MKKIFVTGGAGYIGSHCVLSLVRHGYEPIILDNFSNSHLSTIKNLEKITKRSISFYNIDIGNKKKLKYVFKTHSCFCVLHCQGLKSVVESCNNPLAYFNKNIKTTLTLLQCMEEEKIFNFIFSSSATVYNENQLMPVKETSAVGKTKNPYARSKYIIEQILLDLCKFDKRWNIGIARYFNPIGNDYSGLISDNPKGIPNNLIPNIVRVIQKKILYLKVFGKNYSTRDGTCIRDYIHVMDLAEAHVAMIKKIKIKKGHKVYNFGSGKGYTVLEVVRLFEKKTKIICNKLNVNNSKIAKTASLI